MGRAEVPVPFGGISVLIVARILKRRPARLPPYTTKPPGGLCKRWGVSGFAGGGPRVSTNVRRRDYRHTRQNPPACWASGGGSPASPGSLAALSVSRVKDG